MESTILKVAKYVVENNSSTRKAAAEFGLSNWTVYNYLTVKLKNMANENNEYEELYEMVLDVLYKNSSKHPSLERIKKAYELLLQGKYIDEIALKLNSTYYIIYRDLTKRLCKLELSEEEIEKVKKILADHKEDNLVMGSATSVSDQNRNFLGQFEKGKTK